MIADRAALTHLEGISDINAIHLVRHYIYAQNELDGKKLANRLREVFDVEDRLSVDGENWFVLVKQQIVPSEQAITEMRTFFETIAADHDAEYDGWAADSSEFNTAIQREPNMCNLGMSFGDALETLKRGHCVTREGWNGKGMWLGLQVPDPDSKMTLPYIYMKTAQGDLVPWLASQTDILTDDWRLA